MNEHQPYILLDGSIVKCVGDRVKSRFGNEYEVVAWTVVGTSMFDYLRDRFKPCVMCCPVVSEREGSCVVAPIRDDEPLVYKLFHVYGNATARIEVEYPVFSGYWTKQHSGLIALTNREDGMFSALLRDNDNWFSMTPKSEAYELLRVVPCDGNRRLITMMNTETITPVTVMLDSENNTIGEVVVGGKPVYKCSIMGDECCHAIGSSDEGRSLATGKWSLRKADVDFHREESIRPPNVQMIYLVPRKNKSSDSVDIPSSDSILDSVSSITTDDELDRWIKSIIPQIQDEMKRHEEKGEPCKARRCREKIAARWVEYLQQKKQLTTDKDSAYTVADRGGSNA